MAGVEKKLLSIEEKQNLWTLMAVTRTMMHNARQKEVRQYNITARQAAILILIESLGKNATTAQISREIGRTSHSTSASLNVMEKKRLVRRVRDLDKKNLVRIDMTEKGRKSYSQVVKRESLNQIMSCLSVEESQQLDMLLRKLLHEALSYSKHM